MNRLTSCLSTLKAISAMLVAIAGAALGLIVGTAFFTVLAFVSLAGRVAVRQGFERPHRVPTRRSSNVIEGTYVVLDK